MAARLDAAVSRAPDALIGGFVLNGLPECVYAAASQNIADFLHRHFNRDPEQRAILPVE